MRKIQSEEFGTVILRELPLPEGTDPQFTVYTPSGRVACAYRLENDPAEYLRIMTLNDDGTDINPVWEGTFRPIYQSNGFRYMPFTDNRRAYIGDYILECTPDCDHTEHAEMIPIHYPEALTKSPGLWMVWSENVVSPDNEYIAWSTLGMIHAVYLAKLRREADGYELDNIRCVSGPGMIHDDPAHPGIQLEGPVRGGEVKQFIRGGLGLSFVGTGRGTGASMVQALDSEEVLTITNTPCYDETTMFSPDEKLGVVMSTRFSPKTNCAVLGLIPRRGNLMTKGSVINMVYMYAVAGARAFTEGANVGPALIDIEKSRTDLRYTGLDLHDPEDRYVYYSPISWHPGSKKAMWNERLRKTLGNEGRVMIAELCDYVPKEIPGIVPVPENIPYATEGILTEMPGMRTEIRIAGKVSGTAVTRVGREDGLACYRTVYDNFSDDGKTFLNGTESSRTPGMTARGTTEYRTDLVLSGEHSGEMKLDLYFNFESTQVPTKLDPKSQGYARYDDITLNVSDMAF